MPGVDEYRDLIEECRRLRRERDELADRCEAAEKGNTEAVHIVEGLLHERRALNLAVDAAHNQRDALAIRVEQAEAERDMTKAGSRQLGEVYQQMKADLAVARAECDDERTARRHLAAELARATFEPPRRAEASDITALFPAGEVVDACPACGRGAAVVTRATLKGETETVCHDCATEPADPYSEAAAC